MRAKILRAVLAVMMGAALAMGPTHSALAKLLEGQDVPRYYVVETSITATLANGKTVPIEVKAHDPAQLPLVRRVVATVLDRCPDVSDNLDSLGDIQAKIDDVKDMDYDRRKYMRLGFRQIVGLYINLKANGGVSPSLAKRIRKVRPKYDPSSEKASMLGYIIGLGDKPGISGLFGISMSACGSPSENPQSDANGPEETGLDFYRPMPELTEALKGDLTTAEDKGFVWETLSNGARVPIHVTDTAPDRVPFVARAVAVFLDDCQGLASGPMSDMANIEARSVDPGAAGDNRVLYDKLGFDRTIGLSIRMKVGDLGPYMFDRLKQSLEGYDRSAKEPPVLNYTIGFGQTPAVLGHRSIDMAACGWLYENPQTNADGPEKMRRDYYRPIRALSEALRKDVATVPRKFVVKTPPYSVKERITEELDNGDTFPMDVWTNDPKDVSLVSRAVGAFFDECRGLSGQMDGAKTVHAFLNSFEEGGSMRPLFARLGFDRTIILVLTFKYGSGFSGLNYTIGFGDTPGVLGSTDKEMIACDWYSDKPQIDPVGPAYRRLEFYFPIPALANVLKGGQ